MKKCTTISCIIWCCLIGVSFDLTSQVNDSTYVSDPLPDILILDSLHQQSEQAASEFSIMPTKIYTRPVSDQLAIHPAFVMRDYGPAGIQTFSSQGSSTAQSSVLFRGINIQNPTLGFVDLTLYPQFLFSSASLGSSALSDNENLGKSIRLNLDANALRPIDLQLKMGSFGRKEIGFGISNTRNKYTHITRVHGVRARNDYYYEPILSERQRLPNALQKGISAVTSHGLDLGNHEINWSTIFSKFDREIPPTRGQASSNVFQKDLSIKSILSHQFSTQKNTINTSLAYLTDRIDYRNEDINIASINRGDAWVLKSRWAHHFNHQWHTDMEVEGIHSIGRSDAYEDVRLINQYKIKGGITYNHKIGTVKLSNSTKWTDRIKPLFLPQIQADFKLNENISIDVNIQRALRVPSLDDLFWQPGGNENLLPEVGWKQVVTANYSSIATSDLNGFVTSKHKKMRHSGNVEFFHRRTNNWIIWVPRQGGIWQPENISSVQSFGVHWQHELSFKAGKGLAKIQLNYGYTQAVDQNDQPLLANRKGKQLIYTPKHQASVVMSYERNSLGAQLRQRWVSHSFADPVNEIKVPGFFLTDASITKKISSRGQPIKLSFNVNNILNTNYEVIKSYPLPGRNWSFQINYALTK